MSTHSVEAKSETGRSGARVEFDKATNTVKITGFYDTYVKLNLRKNEWSLEDFLRILGIDEAIEKKYKKEMDVKMTPTPSMEEVVITPNSEKPSKPIVAKKSTVKKETATKTPSTKITYASSKVKVPKESIKKESKPKVVSAKRVSPTPKLKIVKSPTKAVVIKVRPKKVEYLIKNKSLIIELENLKPVNIAFKFRKERVDAERGSVYLYITHSGNRVRFIPPKCSGLPQEIMHVSSQLLNKKNEKFSEVDKRIDSIIVECKTIFNDIDAKYKKSISEYISKIELENIRKKIMG